MYFLLPLSSFFLKVQGDVVVEEIIPVRGYKDSQPRN